MKVYDNFLLLKKQTELSQRLLNSFLYRLTLFLQISIPRSEYPKIKRFNYIDSTTNACYDHENNEVQFSMSNYRIKSEKFIYKKLDIPEEAYMHNYCVCLSDIYHELIHFVQFHQTKYLYTPFLEATNELFVYILTGSSNVEYKKEALAFWHVLRNILGYKSVALYKMLRNAIIRKDFTEKYLLTNPKFLKFLSKKFDSDVKKFYFNFVKLKVSDEEKCWEDLDKLHNLIFYKW